jgi:hypothetical protein
LGSQSLEPLTRHAFWYPLKELTFFLPDMGRKLSSQLEQRLRVQVAFGGAAKVAAKDLMFSEQVSHKRVQFGELPGGGEEQFFLCLEVDPNFQVENVSDLLLPGRQVHRPGLYCAFNSNAEGQGVLMLV